MTDRPATHRPRCRPSSGKRPERVTLEGRWITLAPLDAEKHAAALFEGANGERAGAGLDLSVRRPLSRPRRVSRPISSSRRDPPIRCFSPSSTTRPAKRSAIRRLMRIDAPNRVIEVGNIIYTPAMQRTAGATEAQYLFARLCLRRPRLSPLRVEMQRAQCALEARRGALRLHVRGRFPPAHDRQGPQSRHRLVRDARQRMAGAQGGLRALARARAISTAPGARRLSLPTSCRRPRHDPTIAEKRAPLRRTAPGARLFRHAKSVGRRLGEISRLARLPGAGDTSAGMAFAAGLAGRRRRRAPMR